MMSIKVTVMAMTLLTVCLLASNASAAYYECCRKYMSMKIPFAVIKGYSLQTTKEMCPINAIIFHTKRGKACTDPAANWVMDYIDRIRNKAQIVHNKTSRKQK